MADNLRKPVAEKTPVTVTVSQILNDLANGIDRRGIAKKYGLNLADVKRMFEHKQLKGKKVRPTVGFELIDDTKGEVAAAAPTGEASVPSEPQAEPSVPTEQPQAQPQGSAQAETKGVW